MDKSTFRHRLAVAWHDDTAVDVFVRSDDGNVEHYWTDADERMAGPEDLGGAFDTDPVLVGGRLIGRSRNQLVEWTWEHGIGQRWLGAPQVTTLPGLVATAPAVIATAGRIDVFAPSLNGPMRHWVRLDVEGAWRAPESLTNDLADAFTEPCVVSRDVDVFDVFAVEATTGLGHWFNDDTGWHFERLTRKPEGENLTGRPSAVWSSPHRLDVFAVRGDGVPVHWGFDGTQWFRDEVRLRHVGAGSDTVAVPGDLTLLSTRPLQMTLLDGDAQAWNLDPEFNDWSGQGMDGGRAFFARQGSVQEEPDPTPIQQDHMSTLDRAPEGGFVLRTLVFTNRHSMGEFHWEGDGDLLLELTDPAPAPGDFTPAVVAPDLLARRPEDLVLLGVRWNENATVVAGPPGELVAGVGAQLTVTLPPQHIAEQVLRVDAAGEPDGPAPSEPVFWASGLSGASRLVVELDEGTRVPLTTEGVLDALRAGKLVPAVNATDSGTQLELPYRLLMTPFRPDGGPITLDHASQAVAGASDGVGLWNTRVSTEGAAPTESAGLTMRPLAADSTDPFTTSLSGQARARILFEEPTARIDRLRLSGLGGSFTASGRWETYEWDHVASLGRDHKVRTSTKGVLYPWGHPAVFVETSERRFETTEEGAIAHLRKRSVLIVSDPVRDLPPSRAFPFTQVRLQRTLADLGNDPGWRRKPFPPPGSEAVQQQRDLLVSEGGNLLAFLYGDDGFTPGEELVAEDLAVSDQNGASLVDIAAAIRRADDTLAALAFVSDPNPGIFFVPSTPAGPISFPAVLAGPSAEIHVDLPVVFFADVRMSDGLTHPAYRSLEDAEMLGEVAAAWSNLGDGSVTISPLRIDLVGATVPQPADSPEVRAVHIVGEARDGGFAPRLGHPPVPGDTVPAGDRWAVEIAMPELSTLAGQQGAAAATMLVALSDELLSGAPDPGLLFRATGEQELKALFSQNSARSGGLAAPDLKINGVSRANGPIDAESFLQQVTGGDLDPAKFLGDKASLLGFNLADLLKSAGVKKAPEIVSSAVPGHPPGVTMKWVDVPLRTTEGQLVTRDDSSMTIDVMLAEGQQTVTCTVKNVMLAFPEREDPPKLLEVSLDEIKFHQSGGSVPEISVSGVKPTFFGFLKLLEDLQKAVQLAGASPSLEASDRGVTARFDLPVPDLTTGAFQLTGLSFHAMIDVPFDERPVTIGLGFASREDPFNVSVLALGGGGYVDIVLDKTGLKRFELALEFGASLEVDFVVASGEVHAMGGLRVVDDEGLSLEGYIRFGGMVEVLGLVSVSVELLVTLTYIEERNSMVGHATMVLEVDLLLFSDSVELDSGEWVLAGDEPAPATERLPTPPPGFLSPRGNAVDPFLGLGRIDGQAVDPATWNAYRAAFDEEALA
jgi:hypothetical protein